MKTVIAAINSRFIHSSLAAWYLKANCSELCGQVEVAEYTINDITDYILMSLYAKHADVLAFSCYIWNMETVLKLADTVKKVSPGIKIILGGPEVSYESVMMLEKYSFIDFILAGEGEQSLDLLLQYLNENYQGLDEIEGLFYKEEGMLIKGKGGFALVKNLDSLKTPYTEQMLASLDNRIMYYESSRGCPFSCSYCISSTFEGVRYFAMEKVKNQLKCFISRGIPQVKFVDRTFNCHKERAKEIFRFIIDNAASTAFHFEVAADLFDDEMFKILSKAPVGLIQFEIGVQTTNSDCLTAIDRKTDLSSVFKNTAKLIEKGKFHIHLDLIAGLPREDYESFKKSFDEVYRLSPNNLQLGFLKMLKGSRIRKEASEYGYKFREYPPYEVLENKYLSFDSVCELKSIEEVVERYYNKGRFIKTLLYITSGFFSSAFEFYRSFAQYNIKNGYLERPLAARELYNVLTDYIEENFSTRNSYIRDLMKLDFLSSDSSGNLPVCLARNYEPGFKDKCLNFLKNSEYIEKYLPEYKGLPPVQIYKQVHFELFRHDITSVNEIYEKDSCILLFDYSRRDRVTGLYTYFQVNF